MNPFEMSMSQEPTYDIALQHLAQANAQKLLGQGENLESELTNFSQTYLRMIDPEIILCTYREHTLLKQHTYFISPPQPGLYLRLYNGRKIIGGAMDSCESDEPWIGPLKWFHCTYFHDFGIGFESGEELVDLGSRSDVAPPMIFEHDMIFLDGMYYGSWDLVHLNRDDIS